MGDDGHTASFFPAGDHLAQALDPSGQARVLPMQAAGAGEPRITLTLPVVLATRQLVLLITGPAKRELLTRVIAADGGTVPWPVRAVIDHARVPLDVYWCP